MKFENVIRFTFKITTLLLFISLAAVAAGGSIQCVYQAEDISWWLTNNENPCSVMAYTAQVCNRQGELGLK